MKKSFKLISYAEAISFLVLMFVAMPMKYLMDMPEAVKYPGWIHGILFVTYVIILVLLASEEKWSIKTTILGFIASLLPFGPFVFHNYLNKME